MFELMVATLRMTYKALGKGVKMSEYDFQCGYCGLQFDGGIMHNKPDVCPACGEADIEDTEKADKQEAQNRAINKHDEELDEDRRNDN